MTKKGSEFDFRDRLSGTWHSCWTVGKGSIEVAYSIELTGSYTLRFRKPAGIRARALMATFQGWDGTWGTSTENGIRLLTLTAEKQKNVGLRIFDAAMVASSIGLGPLSYFFRFAVMAGTRQVYNKSTGAFYTSQWEVSAESQNRIVLTPRIKNFGESEPMILERF